MPEFWRVLTAHPELAVAASVGGLLGIVPLSVIRADISILLRVLLCAFGSLAMAITAAGVVVILSLSIDDWSACRLLPSMGILYGYPIYALANDPANAFAYGPVGAWIYLPAAIVGKACDSVTAGLLSGILLSLILMIVPPLLLLLQRSKNLCLLMRSVTAIIVLACFVSLPPLRYIAFTIHADAIALFCGALAVIAGANATSKSGWGAASAFASGSFLALSVMSKQTMIPMVGVIGLIVILLGAKKSLQAALGFVFVMSLVTLIVWFTDSLEGMTFFFFQFFLGVPVRMSALDAVRETLPWLTISFAIFALVLAAGWVSSREAAGTKPETRWASITVPNLMLLGFLVAAIGYIPVGVMGAKSIGGDVNHYGISLYFFLMATAALIAVIPTIKYRLVSTVFLAAALLLSSVKSLEHIPRFPRWYLFENNFLEQARIFSRMHPGEIYFPWQPVSVLLGEGRLYHLGEQLHYEKLVGLPPRPTEEVVAHIPENLRGVAIRPHGAKANVLDIAFPEYTLSKSEALLPNWTILMRNESQRHPIE